MLYDFNRESGHDNIICYINSGEFSIAINRGTILVLTLNCTKYFNGKGEKVAEFERKRECISKPVVLKEIKENPFYFEETDLIKDIRTTIRYISTVPETVQIEEVKKLRTKIESFPIIGDQAMEQHTQITNHIDTIVFDIGGIFSFPDPNLKYRIAHWAVNNELAFGFLKSFKYEASRGYTDLEEVINLFEATWKGLRAEGEHYNLTKASNQFVSLLLSNSPHANRSYIQAVCNHYFTLMNMRFIALYTEDMLKDLKSKGYKLYYLSNLCQFQLDQQRKLGRLNFLEYFDGGVFSCETPWRKPDERLYRFLIEKYQLNPQSSLFFDDVFENIEVAEQVGFHGIQFNARCDSPYGQLNSSPILTTIKDLPLVV